MVRKAARPEQPLHALTLKHRRLVLLRVGGAFTLGIGAAQLHFGTSRAREAAIAA